MPGTPETKLYEIRPGRPFVPAWRVRLNEAVYTGLKRIVDRVESDPELRGGVLKYISLLDRFFNPLTPKVVDRFFADLFLEAPQDEGLPANIKRLPFEQFRLKK